MKILAAVRLAKMLNLITGISLLYLLLGLLFCPSCYGNGSIEFVNTVFTVNEINFEKVELSIRRFDGFDDTIGFKCEVVNGENDFIDPVATGRFSGASTLSSCSLYVNDDIIPEGNETFTVNLINASGSATLGSKSKATITIIQNDDPYGRIGFGNHLLEVFEPEHGSINEIDLNITREGGVIGDVMIYWKIFYRSADNIDDLSPLEGTVLLSNGESNTTVMISILDDNVPENDEIYTVRIVNITGLSEILENNREMELRIKENDAPIAFQSPFSSVLEPHIFHVIVLRGVDTQGRVGPIDHNVNISYESFGGSAIANHDYIPVNGTLIFDRGITRQDIIINIIADNFPELRETFNIRLFNNSENIVIVQPNVTEIRISKNDDPNGVISFKKLLMTDIETVVLDYQLDIQVNRSMGLYGNISVSWNATTSQDDFCNNIEDILQFPSGTVEFLQNENIKMIHLQVKNHTVPWKACPFIIELSAVYGGARLSSTLEGNPKVRIIARDRNDAYGVFNIDPLVSSLELFTNPRRITVSVTRSGGSFGLVDVNISANYLLPGELTPSRSILLEASPVTIQMIEGQRNATVVFTIRSDVFLKSNAVIRVMVDSAELQDIVILHPITPSPGEDSTLLINITMPLANGEISFSGESNDVTVIEPDGSASKKLNLTVIRDGTISATSVQWRVVLITASLDDIGLTKGIIHFPIGSSAVNLIIDILPDLFPELDETFNIELFNVSGPLERLRPGGNISLVTIAKNDNPGGTFQFSSARPIQLFEDSTSFQSVNVIRSGGSLEEKRLLVEILPKTNDFSPQITPLDFGRGVTSLPVFIYPALDDIPEIDEHFNVTLSSFTGDDANIGTVNRIPVTIFKNDDPNGVVVFVNSPSNIVISSDEKQIPTVASFELERQRGSYGNISIAWMIVESPSQNPRLDLQPVKGTVYFGDGEKSGFINITVIPDETTELDEYFSILLVSGNGGAKVGIPQLATLKIPENDALVSFKSQDILVDEGNMASVVITLNRIMPSDIDVSYRTEDISAISPADFTAHGNTTIRFQSGEVEKVILINTNNDSFAEKAESMIVRLLASTGDTVFSSQRTATVTIKANDLASGTFALIDNGQPMIVREGDILKIGVQRSGGLFGNVSVYWEELNNASVPVMPSKAELKPMVGFVLFVEGQQSGFIEAKAKMDGLPELNETLIIQLLNTTVQSVNLGYEARLSSSDTLRASVTILENDDPRGLFKFAPESRDLTITEDRLIGYSNNSNISLSVERTMGLYHNVEILWQTFYASSVDGVPYRLWDAFFQGMPMNNLSTIQSRKSTTTTAYLFDGIDDYFLLESTKQPSTQDVSQGFTITAWILPTIDTNGTIFSKSQMEQNGYKEYLNVHLTVPDTVKSIEVSFITNGKENSFLVYIPTDISLNNGDWHSIALSVSETKTRLFIDGKEQNPQGPSGIAAFIESELYVGCSYPGVDHFKGSIQDVSIYPKALTASEMRDVGAQFTALYPTNGYLFYPEGINLQNFSIESIDNSIPEDKKQFAIRVVDVKGGARIDRQDATAKLEVEKSDFSNGLFGFSSSPCSQTASEDSQNITFTIDRQKGSFQSVTLNWQLITQTGALATADFVSTSGSIVFEQAQRNKNITIYSLNDTLPELQETFVLRLTSVTSEDGITTATLSSGAIIDVTRSSCNVIIESSDDPYGVFQLMSSKPPSGGLIIPSISHVNISVTEESGFVKLYIVRAQGVQGQVGCEWRTKAITAVENVDFAATVSVETFPPFQNSIEINLDIPDNSLPELEKTFSVELFNPSGGARLGKGSMAYITILPSDDAFGIFSLMSLDIVNFKEGDNVVIPITRQAGALGPATLQWRVTNIKSESEINPYFGNVTIAKGEYSGLIRFAVIDDEIPELNQQFTIELYQSSEGRINQSENTVIITILSNDYPFGLFVLSPDQIIINEANNSMASINIYRERSSNGTVHVSVSTRSPSVIDNSMIPAKANDDYISVSEVLIFGPGEINKTLNVKIIEDSIPEAREYFIVEITNVRLIDVISNVGPDSLPAIGQQSTTNVIINSNDFANGVLQFSASRINLTEDDNQSFVNITRTSGLFGQVSISYEIINGPSLTSDDYVVRSFEVVFNKGDSVKILPVTIANDDIPEFNEQFTIRLLPQSIKGGAVIGAIDECIVFIAENDYPYGLLEFSKDSLSNHFNEPRGDAEPVIVKLNVTRSGGTEGPVQVVWNSTSDANSMMQISPSSGHLLFLSGESWRELSFGIVPDDTAELNQTIHIFLQSTIYGKAIISDSDASATIVILSNDRPFGIVEFANSSYNVMELNITYTAGIELKRSRSFFGSLEVHYSTFVTSSSTTASSNGDFVSVNNGIAIFNNGETTAIINITILADNIPEIDEQFSIRLTSVRTINYLPRPGNEPEIGLNSIVNVTILSNDAPQGEFELTLRVSDAQSNGQRYSIEEPQGAASVAVAFVVTRTQGVMGDVSISWRLGTIYTINIADDIDGGNGGSLNFKDGEKEQAFVISIKNDTVPEIDEYFTVELYNPTGGAIISTSKSSVDVIVEANDDVAGIISFMDNSKTITVLEGDTGTLLLERSLPARGNVTLDWKFVSATASEDFQPTQGKVFFAQGARSASVIFTVKVDLIPELNKQFVVTVFNPIVGGISQSGAENILTPSDGISAVVSLGASNEPHGVFEFSPSSMVLTTTEGSFARFEVIRAYGTIGDVLITYQALPNPSAKGQATSGLDFDGNVTQVTIKDGQKSFTITLLIVNDDIPEENESFFVNITSVTLAGVSPPSSPPKIGQLNSVEVIIKANDGAQGELAFSPESVNQTFSEGSGSHNLTVQRYRGAFGQVYCFYFVNRLTASESDFQLNEDIINGGVARLDFQDGERSKNITIHIIDDDITETSELFEIGLTIQNAVNNGGVTIGNPSRTHVTIEASDDAYGVFEFSDTSSSVILQEPPGASLATLTIRRLQGTYGTVVVQFKFVNNSAGGDLSPRSTTVTFDPNVNEVIVEVRALDDHVAELDLTYIAQLSIISGGGRLGNRSTSTITIKENDDPYGRMSLQFTQSNLQSFKVEETVRYVEFMMMRYGGTNRQVTCDIETKSISAVSLSGTTLQFAIDQVLTASNISNFHYFAAFGEHYLLVSMTEDNIQQHHGLTIKKNTLMIWRGVFVPIQVFDGEVTVSWTSIIINGETYLIQLNHGSFNHFETNSTVYKMVNTTYASVVQQIQTIGATDALTFQSVGESYIVVANQMDNDGDVRVKSQVFRWSTNRFVVHGSGFETSSAVSFALFTVANTIYLVVANNYNLVTNSYSTFSTLHEWSISTRQFRLYERIPTIAANGVTHAEIAGSHYLIFSSSMGGNKIVKFLPGQVVKFKDIQSFNLMNSTDVEFFRFKNQDYLIFAGSPSSIHRWNSTQQQFNHVLNFSNAIKITSFNMAIPALAEAIHLAFVGVETSMITRPVLMSHDSDFISRNSKITFVDGQSKAYFTITILNDSYPEVNEDFEVLITNPSNQLTLDTNSLLSVVILSNDNAFGRFEFNSKSLNITTSEREWDSVAVFDIDRHFGSFGRIALKWHLTNGNVDDIYPTSGSTVFEEGQTTEQLRLFVRKDEFAEIDEIFQIRLVSVSLIDSTPVSTPGPAINEAKSLAYLTILANDHPFGIFQWRHSVAVATENIEVNSSVVLVIQRINGAFGNVLVNYETTAPYFVGSHERIAIPDIDYMPVKSHVTFKATEKEKAILIGVRHDNSTAKNELFLVNITSLQLISVSPPQAELVTILPTISENKSSIQVIITEIEQVKGLIQFVDFNKTLIVEENVGIIRLRVERYNGSEGTVGVEYNLQPITSSLSDFQPITGVVTFIQNETFKEIEIRIVDDELPELQESFVVTLTEPIGGVAIGNNRDVTIIINENDYPYGLIRFASSSLLFSNVLEGSQITLHVQRIFGLIGSVTVTWRCETKASDDIDPITGLIQFEKDQTDAYFNITIIDDNIPELAESYSCALVSATNQAEIDKQQYSATIIIASNDKPYGVVRISDETRNILTAEPQLPINNGAFTVKIQRNVGSLGSIIVFWKITTSDQGTNDEKNTFNVTSGNVLFSDGVPERDVNIQVKPDLIPEKSRRYIFSIIRIDGLAELETVANASIAHITVADSGNPYGIFSFDPPFNRVVQENVGDVQISLKRSGGCFGSVDVKLDVKSGTARNNRDFIISDTTLTFEDSQCSKIITITIVNDTDPELSEFFLINITSAILLHPILVTETFANGILTDTPPRIDFMRTVTMTIDENDKPYGVIEFKSTSLVVHEWESRIDVVVVRNGGTYGNLSVTYDYLGLTASYLTDFIVPGSSINFPDGVSTSIIPVRIINDDESEIEEMFELFLRPSFRVQLGAKTTARIIIAASDNPYGIFGFYNVSMVQVANPIATRTISMTVYRSGGRQGASTVSWQLSRKINSQSSLSEDITPGSGQLVFNDNGVRFKSLSVNILPYGGPQEVAEEFILKINGVTGFGSIDVTSSNITIHVQKKGHPNGKFSFVGTALPSSSITEPETGYIPIIVQIRRTLGFAGSVKIDLGITGITNTSIPQEDLLVTSYHVMFIDGQATADFHINVSSDDIPELDESFKVQMLSADNGGDIDSTSNSVIFSIRENDRPYGVFQLLTVDQLIEYDVSTNERFVYANVERRESFMGDVDVYLKITANGISLTPTIIMLHGKSKIKSRIALPPSVFLAVNSIVSIEIVKVAKRGAGETLSPPVVNANANHTSVVIDASVANSIVSFTKNALRIDKDNDVYNVEIIRNGTLGNIDVEWKFGYPISMLPTGLVEGQLTPSRGIVTMANGQQNAHFNFTVTPPVVIDRSLVYAIHLTENLSPPRLNFGWAMVGERNLSIIEPHGVVELLGETEYSVIEGNLVNIKIIRHFSTLGRIHVNVTTSVAVGSTKALPGIDFVSLVTSVVMETGQYEAVFNVSTLNQDVYPELDEIFYADLTSVHSEMTVYDTTPPRLGEKTRAQITIRDDDNPFGVVGFESQFQNINVNEATTTINLQLTRTFGAFSVATVRVRSVGGGESWQDEIINALPVNSELRKALLNRVYAATANVDYLPVDEPIRFAEQNTPPVNGQREAISLTIFNDNLPEPPEQIFLVLTNVTGGARLANFAGDLKYFSIVTIDSNGLWNGQIRFESQVATLDEDTESSAVNLTLERSGSASQNVTVTWEVISPSQPELVNQIEKRSGSVIILAGETNAYFTIVAKKDTIPELQQSVFVNLTGVSAGATLDTKFSIADVILAPSDYPDGLISFQQNSRYVVVELGDTEVQLILHRSNGTLSEVTVTYETVSLTGAQTDGSVVISAALEGQDYQRKTGTVKFAVGQRQAFITVSLVLSNSQSAKYPRAFKVALTAADKTARLSGDFKTATVTVSNQQRTSQFLKLRYNSLAATLSDSDIEGILSQLLTYASQTPLTTDDVSLMKNTILTIIRYKTALPIGEKALTAKSQSTLLDIFNVLLNPSRSDTSGLSDWAKVVEESAYVLLNDRQCPTSVKESRERFSVSVERRNVTFLNGKTYFGSNFEDFLRYPVNMFSTSNPNYCEDLHFIEYENGHWFPSSGRPILGNKVLSSAVKSGLPSGMRVVYRIHTTQDRVTSTDAICVIWKYALTSQSSSGWDKTNCILKGETNSYVECSCAHLSEYAIQAFSDNRTGYEVYFYVACFICAGACLFALLSHHLCSVQLTFTASLLMHMFFAIMVTNILYAVSGYISPSLLDQKTECSILSIFMHYFFLCQFTWMFIQGCNLWRILVMNDEHTYRKFVPFFLAGWGLPVIVVIAYIFITYAIYDWKITDMYNDVHGNGDMCFMSNPYSVLATVVGPVLLLLMGILIVFVQAYQVTPQWKCYDDIYRGRYNLQEMRHFIILFLLVTIVWIFAGFHMAYGKLWMVIVFTVADVALGLYIFIVFAIFRNQMRNMCRGNKYSVRSETMRDEGGGVMYAPRTYTQSGRNVNESQQQLDENDWEDIASTPTVDRRRFKQPATASPIRNRPEKMFDDDAESQDFDDLIYALKTGGQFTPPPEDENDGGEELPPSSSEHYEMRRVDIADTHL